MKKQADNDAPRARGVPVPARIIPAPTTISPEAQLFLSNPPPMGDSQAPALTDKDGWRAYIAAGEALLSQLFSAKAQGFPSTVIVHELTTTSLYDIRPATLTAQTEGRAIFHLHGGAFVNGAGITGAQMAFPLAHLAKVRTLSVDYRMPPDHPFPAALDDAVEAYRWLLNECAPENIVVAGGSAGGGLAASLLLKVRDMGMPLPAGCILFTPEADLTESGDTFETNDTVDVVLGHRLTGLIALYADGHDLKDPYLSPVFGDFDRGFPPTLLQSGTRDLFLSNTVRLHRALRKAGVEAELHVWEAMPHGGFFGAPEDEEVLAEQARFIEKCFSAE